MIEITGATKLYPIIGDPIAQVRSPILVNDLFAKRNIDALCLPLHIPAAELETVVAGLRRVPNLGGLIVTVPHKVPVCALVDGLSERVRRVGAANAIRCHADGRWTAEIFDGLGCIAGLRQQGHDPAGRSVLLIGTGGAGRAVADALAEAGVARLTLCDVEPGRAEAVAATLAPAFPGLDVRVGGPDPRGYDWVLNATPLGMAAGDPLPLDPARLEPTTLVADIIMKPPVTPLLAAAAARGCPIHAGAHTLDGQVVSWLGFFGLA